MQHNGTLFGVGVGPGDPELLTLKAMKVITSVPILALPGNHTQNIGHAMRTIEAYIHPRQIILSMPFSMSKILEERISARRTAIELIIPYLRQGQPVACITEGDPLFYSTFSNLLPIIPDDIPVEIIPGITSFTAAASAVNLPIVNGNQRMAILPATNLSINDFKTVLHDFDTLILLKIYQRLDEIIGLLKNERRLQGAIIIEHASLPSQRIYRNIRDLAGQSLDYMSLMIISKA